MDQKTSVLGNKIDKMNKVLSEIDLDDIFKQSISDHKDVKFHRRMSRDVFADSSDANDLYHVNDLDDLSSFPFTTQVCVSMYGNFCAIT